MSLNRNARGFTLIELLIVVVIIGILALAAIPLISDNTRDAKAAESRAALGTIKDRLRVKYIQNNNTVNTSWTIADLVNTTELTGKYYGGSDYSMTALTATTATFQAAANTNNQSPQVTLAVTNIQSGQGTITSP
ncbi:MAG: prepilin-type N-terminal cleavage/methylation domain-containing protein [Planctomycetes bacterium]|nr:prepilin-type N-terminal cleavage/methylation domain-containing protein [Planctomycetota bacterium]